MSVTNINSGSLYTAYSEKSVKLTSESGAPQKNEKNTSLSEEQFNADSFEKSTRAEDKATGYEKLQKLSQTQIDSIKTMQEDNLRNLVSQLFGKQASLSKGGQGSSTVLNIQFNQSITNLEINASQSVDTQKQLWDVDSVATRIMDMAVSLSGGDQSKISVLKDAVVQGFKEAGQAWGDKLPEVCNNTYDEVMKRFDHWEKNGSLDSYVYQSAKTEA